MHKSHSNTYNKLAKFLREHGYIVNKVVHVPNYSYGIQTDAHYVEYQITGKNICALFCTPTHGYNYNSVNGKIAADHVDCFDKWSRCAVIMKVSGINKEMLLKQLEYLGSQQGLEESNAYNFDNFIQEK